MTRRISFKALLIAALLLIISVTPAGAEVERATTTHTVQWGENLYRISLQYDVSVDSIMAANDITNSSRIYAGQVLVIPDATTGGGPETTPPESSSTYIVKRGDTLSRISRQFGVPLSVLIQRNNLSNPSMIYPGQEIILDGSGAPPASNPGSGPGSSAQGKQIVVKLSEQRVYAYQNGELVNSFIVSTGLPQTPTVTGDFSIYLKYDSQWMSGPGYSLPGVPWVMYFYRGYGFHGTYWHSNFGQPMSHGCVNMRTSEAQWLYNWAPMGTAVRVEY